MVKDIKIKTNLKQLKGQRTATSEKESVQCSVIKLFPLGETRSESGCIKHHIGHN
jgi:hypothetical protein